VILGAALLVLAGLGLFVAGVLTGVTALYWACVGVCGVAAVLLIASRRQPAPARPAEAATGKAAPPSAPRTAENPAVPAEPAPPAEVETTVREVPAASTGATAAGAATTGSLPAQGRGAHAAPDVPAGGGAARIGEPGVEEVEVTDLLLVVDLTDEVLVVDEHPRYHLEGCRYLSGRETIPLPLDEARTDGFTPCALCAPDRHLADRERARKAAAKER
jgi:hypothetical protein